MNQLFFLLVKKINTKNGAPIRAVTAPTGISLGEIMVLAIRSATDMKAPPIRKLIGITALCFDPKILLTT